MSVKEFKFSQKKQHLLKISGLAVLGNYAKIREFVVTLNKKQEVIPWKTILQRILAAGQPVVCFLLHSLHVISPKKFLSNLNMNFSWKPLIFQMLPTLVASINDSTCFNAWRSLLRPQNKQRRSQASCPPPYRESKYLHSRGLGFGVWGLGFGVW